MNTRGTLAGVQLAKSFQLTFQRVQFQHESCALNTDLSHFVMFSHRRCPGALIAGPLVIGGVEDVQKEVVVA
jgi:hypothetical protein